MADSKGNSVRIRLEYLFGKLNEEQSASSTYRALNELRAKFVPHPPRLSTFIQCGGMKHIVTQLQSSNKKIVDVSLSILGHCVMEPEPRVLVCYINICKVVINFFIFLFFQHHGLDAILNSVSFIVS